MTERRIKELAKEVSAELGIGFDAFAIDHVEQTGFVLNVTFSWKAPDPVQASIDLNQHRSDDAVEEELRRQLRRPNSRSA